MTTKSEPYFWIVCDFPECGARSTEYGDYSAWSDAGQAHEEAESSEWLCTDNGDYCTEHIIFVEHDEEQEDSNGDWSTELRFPMPNTLEYQFILANRRINRIAEARAHSASLRIDMMHHGREDREAIRAYRNRLIRPVRASEVSELVF